MPTTLQTAVKEAVAEVIKGGESPLAFVAGYRRLAKCPGLARKDALQIAQGAFAASYKAYVHAQERGETLPPLDRTTDELDARRAAAFARGGII